MTCRRLSLIFLWMILDSKMRVYLWKNRHLFRLCVPVSIHFARHLQLLIQALMEGFLYWDVMQMNVCLHWLDSFPPLLRIPKIEEVLLDDMAWLCIWWLYNFADDFEQDMSKQPPTQELVAKDLHGTEWRFRHIFRGDFCNLKLLF